MRSYFAYEHVLNQKKLTSCFLMHCVVITTAFLGTIALQGRIYTEQHCNAGENTQQRHKNAQRRRFMSDACSTDKTQLFLIYTDVAVL